MNYILFGGTGRMGKEIQAASERNAAICIKSLGRNDKLDDVDGAEVAIDFSQPENFKNVLSVCVNNKIPLVSGTTGLTKADFDSLSEAAKKIPILWAANTSLGVEVLRSLLHGLKPLKDWDFHIVESHHIHKKDAPSGTAKVLKENLESVIEKEIPNCSSIRGGGIFGEHEIHIMGPNETLILKHKALSRALFADGALKAAQFLKKQKVGLYTMSDVLGALG